MIVTLTEENFAAVMRASQPVFLHFWSDFCGPCKVQSRVLEQFDEKYNEKIILSEISSLERSDWIEAFGVQSTPTTLVFNQGKPLARLTGVHTLTKIEKIMNQAGLLN